MTRDTLSYVLWTLLIGSGIWLGIGAVSETSDAAYYALPFIVLGGIYASHAIYRLRTPRWYEQEWWTRNRTLAFALIGARPGSLGRLGEVAAALLALGFGIVMLVVGALGAISAI